jgi:LytS/YehU family sensor histidine kinase
LLTLILLTGPFLFLSVYGISFKSWKIIPENYFSFLFVTLFCLVISAIARATYSWFIRIIRREDKEKQVMHAELSFLKSQINPHFLFNTLNNIHSLAYKQSPSTPEAIMQLSSLMRYMLYESNTQAVLLQHEINYLQDFISLQQLRYAKTPIVEFVVNGDPTSCRVAPLLFIHFVENAYKHSPAQLDVRDIKVTIEIKENSISFYVQNPIRTHTHKAIEDAGGIGLNNVIKRLQLLYPRRHKLDIYSSVNQYKVELQLDTSLKQ